MIKKCFNCGIPSEISDATYIPVGGWVCPSCEETIKEKVHLRWIERINSIMKCKTREDLDNLAKAVATDDLNGLKRFIVLSKEDLSLKEKAYQHFLEIYGK